MLKGLALNLKSFLQHLQATGIEALNWIRLHNTINVLETQ